MNKQLIPLLAAMAPMLAAAHVSLETPIAEPGVAYQGVLRVGHGCDGSPTTALKMRLPAGFADARALPKVGWTIEAKAGVVSWTAAAKDVVLPPNQRGEFPFTVTAPRKPGNEWVKVLQTCEKGTQDWADVPATGTSTAGMKTPAMLLNVLAPREFAMAKMLPRVEGGWVRGTVAGQSGTGAFMRFTASEPVTLVSVATPVAGTAEVHEMKMEGDVMRMRAVPKLDLPAGQTIELKPGGYHLMLTDLKQALQKDTVVPVTLVFRNARGLESRMDVSLPVQMQGPDGAAGGHKH